MTDRRVQPRVSLDVDFCMLSHQEGADLVALIKDISRDGLCIELATWDAMELIMEGEPVTLHEFPEQLGLSVASVLGQIAWRKGDYCGVVFLHPLSEEYETLLACRDKQLELSSVGLAS